MKPKQLKLANEPKILRQQRLKEQTVLIRNMAVGLGIDAIEIEQSDLLKDTLRVAFADCTGRKQILYLPFTATAARISQTLRFVSGSRRASAA